MGQRHERGAPGTGLATAGGGFACWHEAALPSTAPGDLLPPAYGSGPMVLIALCGAGKLFFDVASRTWVKGQPQVRFQLALWGAFAVEVATPSGRSAFRQAV
mgnify:CR=1 FL=1